MQDFTELASVRAVLDRARGCITREDLWGLVMSDPGSGAYVAAYERVLAGGAPALLEDHDGTRLFESFDIKENLLLSHSDASRSLCHRWFSVLTACIELLGWDGDDGLNGAQPSQTLCNLLTDSFALHAANDALAPLDLLPRLFKELEQTFENRHDYVLALLCELLVAKMGDADVEAKCHELNLCHDEFQEWCDEDGVENLWFTKRPEFIWGAVLRGSWGGAPASKDLRKWLELAKAHFPTSPELARATAERLLRDGEKGRRV
jgi:hypothetical protein